MREKGYAGAAETINFQTKSGLLSAKSDGEYVTLGFPSEKVSEIRNIEDDLKKLMGLTPVFVGRTRFDYLIQVESDKTVINLAPDFAKLKGIDTRGIIVTARSTNPAYDFVSRFFAPSIGINEDPVTGSAHCALGPYWGALLKKSKLTGYQASHEGGIVKVEVLKNSVLLSGRVQEVPVPDKIKKAIQSC